VLAICGISGCGSTNSQHSTASVDRTRVTRDAVVAKTL
jgi:hypothetical protein